MKSGQQQNHTDQLIRIQYTMDKSFADAWGKIL